MKKNFFTVLFVFVLPSVSFSQRSFDSRHSLMPKSVDDVKEEESSDLDFSSNVPVEVPVVKDEKTDIYSEPVIVSSEGVKVDDGNESFFLKRPVADNSFDNQNDFRTSGPKLDKPEGYDELMQMVKEQGGVIKPSSYTEDKNGNLILAPVSSKSISSNVINEKKGKMINRPLFAKSKNKTKGNKPYQSVAHIATYNDRESAKKGIDVFVSLYPNLKNFEPFISNEYVDGKGELYRLYFLGDESELLLLCREMKASGDWCNILK